MYLGCWSLRSPIFWKPKDQVVTVVVSLCTHAMLSQSRSRVVSQVKPVQDGKLEVVRAVAY